MGTLRHRRYRGRGRYGLERSGEIASRVINASDLRAGGMIVVGRGDDTVRIPIAGLRGPRADAPEFIRLGRGIAPNDTDAVPGAGASHEPVYPDRQATANVCETRVFTVQSLACGSSPIDHSCRR